MYNRNKELEDKCFTVEHTEQVFDEIKSHFPRYFDSYIETCAGVLPSFHEIQGFQQTIGISASTKSYVDSKKNMVSIVENAITHFESDRESYEFFFQTDDLDEYYDDPNSFKKKFATDCGIVRVTLHSKEKSLDVFRRHFKLASSQNLLDVAVNITQFAEEHPKSWKDYDYDHPYTIANLVEDNVLELDTFDTEGYGVFGVIGGGIKSYIAHKLSPQYFPHRSREAVWALWYLVNKDTFGCEEDSEFLMIDTELAITNQNFYYPYGLFGVYCYLIYTLMRDEMARIQTVIPEEYRYVLVNHFLQFVANQHEEEIKTLSRNIREVVFE